MNQHAPKRGVLSLKDPACSSLVWFNISNKGYILPTYNEQTIDCGRISLGLDYIILLVNMSGAGFTLVPAFTGLSLALTSLAQPLGGIKAFDTNTKH